MQRLTTVPLSIIAATRNRHKVREIQHLLAQSAVVLDLDSVPGAPLTVENAPDFAGNAIRKSCDLANFLRSQPSGLGIRNSLASPDSPRMLSAARTLRPSELGFEPDQLLVLADDSGLEVNALDGAPGVHSARFAADDKPGAENASDAANRAKLLGLMQQIPAERRQARFRCVLALVRVERSHGQPQLFEGVCEGSIGFAERGTNGFGYDSLFIPNGFEKTFAELGDEMKNTISHRARAIEKLKSHLGGMPRP